MDSSCRFLDCAASVSETPASSPALYRASPRLRVCRSGPGAHIILALSLAELDNWNLLLFDKALHPRHEAFRHGIHQRPRGERMTAMTAEELHDSGFAL